MSVTGLNMKFWIQLKNPCTLKGLLLHIHIYKYIFPYPMAFPWSFFQAHHPHKAKKSTSSNQLPMDPTKFLSKPSRLITAASKCQQFHGILPFAAFLAGAQDTVESNDLGRQKVLAVVIFPRSITSSQYTTPLQATLTSTSKHCISSSKLQAAWPFQGHGPTGHPSTGGAFGENDAMPWGAIIGWEPRLPSKLLNPSYAQVKSTVSKNSGTPKWMVYNGKPY